MEPVASFGIFELVFILIFIGAIVLMLAGVIATYFFLHARNSRE
jgi:hypothetical protein